jgi:hypothetical protein
MRVAPQVSLPADGPQTIFQLAPPGAAYLGPTNAVNVTLALSAGIATVSPYWYNGTNWVPLRGDTAIGVSTVAANFASVPIASLTFRRPMEGRWFALLLAGAGTVSYAEIEEAVL